MDIIVPTFRKFKMTRKTIHGLHLGMCCLKYLPIEKYLIFFFQLDGDLLWNVLWIWSLFDIYIYVI